MAIEHSNALKNRALGEYRRLGTVRSACMAAGIGRRTWYDWVEADRGFAALVHDAREDIVDELEETALNRAKAKDGSDGLLQFLLKAHRPEKYRESATITLVSPLVRDKVRRTVDVIRAELTKELADPLLAKLKQVWQ